MVAGFPQAGIEVSADGRTVAITIPVRSACTAQPGDEAQVVNQLEKVAPFLSRVTLHVASSGESLSSYVTDHCLRSGLPPGPGMIVFDKTGSGYVTSGPFTVRSRHWAIDFENKDAFFVVFVLKNGKFLPQTITAHQRAVGSKTLIGTGSFRLRITGSGHWTVRVRDGT